MKNIKYIVVFVLFGLFACEDVIDLDLETAEPRLVDEASIDWYKGQPGSLQKIKLMTTTGYYNQSIPMVSGANVWIENQNGIIFNFVEDLNSGEYICNDFLPELGMTYTLNLMVNQELYTAVETLKEVPDILYVEQNNEGGFGDDTIEIKFFYQDAPLQDNSYMSLLTTSSIQPSYRVSSDELFQGNIMYSLYFLDDTQPGDQLNFELYGISQRYYNYMTKLLSAANSGGGPFQSTPSTLRGNLINQTNPDNYALGYFRLSEVVEAEYIVE